MTPNPGSKEARDLGCKCPVIDNGYGIGILGGIMMNGKPQFYFDSECPIHGLNSREQK